ncbi:MAG: CHAT domain-containing protein [Blastocatellia bacterium]|nr:CHAT domain-containing protein [Blastocatellia bacterium]
MLVWKAQNNDRVAIFYGKQAINAYQEIRGNIKSLDKESRQSYLEDKERHYRTLADMLISEGRLPEAEKVIEMLKEEEFSKIVRRSDSDKSEIGLTKAETEAAKSLDLLAAFASERGQLLARMQNRTATAEDRQRLDLIEAKITQENKNIRIVLAEVKKASPDARIDDRESQSIMGSLGRLGEKTVALYTVVSDEKGWIILVTPDFRRAYPIDVNGLNRNIADLRRSLKDDTYDPVPSSQKLYRALFLQPNDKGATLAADLEAYGARTLMWSLDGTLRYVPVAALHDGEGYLVRRYRNTVFNKESLTRLLDPVSADWRALGLGVSKEHPGFQALIAVPRELRAIIRDERQPESDGVLRGAIRIDERFTRSAMIDGLREGYGIVHIASHFSYNVASEELSFLLLGDGTRLSLEEITNFNQIFAGLELLTLSACDTATGGANGKEVEGLAYQAQWQGAKAVVASLWPVSDDGTEVLMREFYRIKSLNPQMSKAEAFQRAQLALLKGAEETRTSGGDKRAAKVVSRSEKDKVSLPLYKRDPKARFAHPHYWAPFILIGNWK